MPNHVLKLFCLLLCVFSLWGCGQRQGGKTSESQPTESPNHEMLSYVIGDAEVAITGYNLFEEGELVIPEQIEGLPVTSIGDSAFADCIGLSSITIPEGVTSIGDWAFRGCSSLTSITIPEGVTSIGYVAFRGCSSLTSITIPDSVTSIGDSAFWECSSLTSITIPDSVTSIKGGAFAECIGLSSITIPDSVTSIGDSAFADCIGLSSISIPQAFHSEVEASRLGLDKLWPDGFALPDSSSK